MNGTENGGPKGTKRSNERHAHPLHGRRWVKRQHHSEGSDEGLEKHDERMKLLKNYNHEKFDRRYETSMLSFFNNYNYKRAVYTGYLTPCMLFSNECCVTAHGRWSAATLSHESTNQNFSFKVAIYLRKGGVIVGKGG